MSNQNKIDQLYLDFCENICKLSKGAKYKVGAVLVKEGRPLANGYNGTPPGYINGEDIFDSNKVRTDETLRKEHREWSAQYEVHAEMNALLYAAKKGIPTEGATLYCSLQPCHNCMKHAICAGINRIVYRYKHKSLNYDSYTIEMLSHCAVELDHIPLPNEGGECGSHQNFCKNC